MGYTHYYRNAKTLTGENIEVCKKIVEQSGVAIFGGDGESDPYFDVDDVDGQIRLNGDASTGQDHESFYYIPGKEFEFCKTARKDYDVVVAAILLYLQAQCKVTFTSDGAEEDGDFDDAKALLERVRSNQTQPEDDADDVFTTQNPPTPLVMANDVFRDICKIIKFKGSHPVSRLVITLELDKPVVVEQTNVVMCESHLTKNEPKWKVVLDEEEK